MCDSPVMPTRAGLRGIRQQASDLIRQEEAGETITVSCRDVAQLGPVHSRQWRRWTELLRFSPGPPIRIGPPIASFWISNPRIRSGRESHPGHQRASRAAARRDRHRHQHCLAGGLHFGDFSPPPKLPGRSGCAGRGVIESTFDALAVNRVVARHYGRIASAVVAAGRRPRAGSVDLLIAATATVHEARRYTRNAADRAGLEGHRRHRRPN
jgi:hypothetical protein